MSRLRSREIAAAERESQRVRTDDEILSYIVQDQEMYQIIVDRARSFACPVLVIDTEDPIRDSIERVLNFERSLRQKFEMQDNLETKTQPIAINR